MGWITSFIMNLNTELIIPDSHSEMGLNIALSIALYIFENKLRILIGTNIHSLLTVLLRRRYYCRR